MPRDKGPLPTKEDVDVSPLLQNPRPSSSTYTFFSEMTPLSFSSTNPVPTATQSNTSPQASSSSFLSTPPASPVTPDDPQQPTTSMSRARPHGKKRHPSYIPRPPNAFILFRSAFIREQNVPGKVEGNHSKLSKIIGLCWKKLSAQERSHWEAQAVIAQAEHRAKYPDWRFSPGSNAQVKREHKEAAASTSTRKKTARSRLKNSIVSVEEEEEGDDGPEGSVENVESAGESSKAKDGKGKAKAKNTTRAQSFEEKRYQKIAGFVADGLKGDELDMALKEWEFERKVTRPVKPAGRSKSIRGTQASSSTATSSSHIRSRSDNIFSKLQLSASPGPPNSESSSSTPIGHQQDVKAVIDDTPMDTSPSILSGVPLTHMYKRSTSAPATNNRLAILPSSSAQEMASEDEGASSSDDPPSASLSPTSAEHSPGTWKPLEVIVLKEASSGVSSPPPPQSQAQTLSRSHAMSPNHMSESRSPGTSTINTFPIPARSSMTASSSPREGHLTWQDAENQRRLDEMREPINWWSSQRGVADAGDRDTSSSAGGSPAHRFMEPLDVNKVKGGNEKDGLASTSRMGYDISGSTTHYSNGGYIEPFRSYEPVPDTTQRVDWTDISQSLGGRTGMVTVIEDPYADDCTPVPISTPSTFVPAPLSSGTYYHNTAASQPPNHTLPASSFSTLTGWAGEYNGKFQSRVWGEEPPPPHHIHTIQPHPTSSQTSISHQQPTNEHYSHSPSSHPWYPQQSDTWSSTLQHAPMTLSAQDWDRMEYKAASEMQLQVEPPPRPLSFIEEAGQAHLRR